MTTRADVDRLSRAQSRVVAEARAELNRFYGRLDPSRPELMRDELLEFVPALVSEYGDLSATVAAEWYEDMRVRELGSPGAVVLGEDPSPEAVRGNVRYAAGGLFVDGAVNTYERISGAVQRHVLYAGRDTIKRNAGLDGVRYARIPMSAHTCAFCAMVASRGFVYENAAAAGDATLNGLGDSYHDDCDCQVVPEFDAEQHHIEGYDPDELYGRYLKARGGEGEDWGDTSKILYRMRRQSPGSYTDGVLDPDF